MLLNQAIDLQYQITHLSAKTWTPMEAKSIENMWDAAKEKNIVETEAKVVSG